MIDGSSLLSRMVAQFAARAGIYCASALIAGVLGIILHTSLILFDLHGAEPGKMDPMMLWRSMSASRQLIAVFGSIFAVWIPVLLAARGTCRITIGQLSGQALSLREILADMAAFLPAALVYSIVIGFPVILGSFLMLIPGILIAALFVLVVPAGVNEPGTIFAVLRRGFSLSGKVFGRSLLITVGSIALIVITLVVRIVGLDQFLTGPPALQFGMRTAVSYIPALLVLVLANICYTLLYLNACKQMPVEPHPVLPAP
jgi:hypothetical protein